MIYLLVLQKSKILSWKTCLQKNFYWRSEAKSYGKRREFEDRDMSKLLSFFLEFLDDHDSDAKLNIQHYSIKRLSLSKEVLPEPLMEKI